MSSFTFSDCPTTLSLTDAERDGKKVSTGSLSLTVRNATRRPLVGTLSVEPEDMAETGWFRIAGAAPTSPAERDMDCEANATQTVRVDIAVPEGAPAGRKVFNLRIATERDPDNDFTDSPAVAFQVKATVPKVEPKPPFPWWIVAVIVGTLVVLGAGVWIWKKGIPKPQSFSWPIAALVVAALLVVGGIVWMATPSGRKSAKHIVKRIVEPIYHWASS